jgi:hypothetical protein
MLISNQIYISTGRTTGCDIMCTTNTERIRSEIQTPKKFKKFIGLKASLPTDKPFSLKTTIIPTDPTPNQSLKFREHRTNLNDELKKEKVEFFKKLQRDRYNKKVQEYDSATKIQALFRGYNIRKLKLAGKQYVNRKYKNVSLSHNDLVLELSMFATKLNLKPLQGLTLPAYGSKKKDANHKFKVAAAIRLQCFFRMITKRLKYLKYKHSKRMAELTRATFVIIKFFKYIHKLGQKQRDINKCRHTSALIIQSFYRIFLSRKWVRKVRKLRNIIKRENDAATRIQRTLFKKPHKFKFAQKLE